MNRLTSGASSAGVCSGATLNWTYDPYGNRWNQSGTGSCYPTTFPSFTFNGLKNRIDGGNYDLSGNLLSDGVHTYTYDAEGRIATVADLGEEYIYDGEGRRVAKRTTGGTLLASYVLDLGGNQVTELNGSGGWVHSNVFAGKLSATYTSNDTRFHLSDWLGSRRVQAEVNGKVGLNCFSYPFGDGLTCSGSDADSTEHHFTGKERDTETGLDYFATRYYASNSGRFSSPDEPFLDQIPNGPQSWNLYGYVRNNPLSNVDPNGEDCIYADGNGGGTLIRGDCKSDTDDGMFVNGTVDENSFRYNSANNSSSFNYTTEGGDIGKGVIQGPNLSGDVALNPFAQQALGLAGQMAGPGVDIVTKGLIAFGYVFAAPVMAAAECVAGSSGCTKTNLAMAVLPEVAALREGALLLKAGRGLNAAEILQKTGGIAQATKDFEALPGKETVIGNLKMKELLDGSKAVLRSFSKDGRPTLELQHLSGEVTKYRY